MNEQDCWVCEGAPGDYDCGMCPDCYWWAEDHYGYDADPTEAELKRQWVRHQERLDSASENGHGFHTPRGDWPDRARTNLAAPHPRQDVIDSVSARVLAEGLTKEQAQELLEAELDKRALYGG